MTSGLDRERLEPGAHAEGWFEDPEAPDLERWSASALLVGVWSVGL